MKYYNYNGKVYPIELKNMIEDVMNRDRVLGYFYFFFWVLIKFRDWMLLGDEDLLELRIKQTIGCYFIPKTSALKAFREYGYMDPKVKQCQEIEAAFDQWKGSSDSGDKHIATKSHLDRVRNSRFLFQSSQSNIFGFQNF